MRAAVNRHSRGVTLLEAVVSIVILGAVVAGIFVSRDHAQQAHTLSMEIMTCTRLCASQAAALRAGTLGSGEGEFEHPKGYRWDIRRLDTPENMPAELYLYDVRVTPPAHEVEAGASMQVWILRQTTKVKKK